MRVFRKDCREIGSFNRIGYKYTRVWNNDQWMLWSMYKPGQTCKKFELWKYKKCTNPDGTEVWAKPSDKDFGRYGWGTFVGSDEIILSQILKIVRKHSEDLDADTVVSIESVLKNSK